MGKLENKKLAIIGVGNMGQSIMKGFLDKRVVDKNNLFLSNSSRGNKRAVKSAQIVILAVKPQVILFVLQEIKHEVSQDQLIISIAAGIEINTIKNILGRKQPVVRVMPNLCAKVGESMSCWVKSKEVTKTNTAITRAILQTIGKEILFENEGLLDRITAISGSGPAYVFYFTEIFVKSAIELGIDKDLAEKLVLQTLIGSVKLLENLQEKASVLRQQVTSKGGTTEAALNVFSRSGVDKTFMKAINAAYKRSKELRVKS